MSEKDDGIAGQNPAGNPSDADKCKCGRPGVEPHHCPYQYDVNDDFDFKCNCCDDCRLDCADDI